MRGRDSRRNSPFQTCFSAFAHFRGGNGGKEAEAADVDSQDGSAQPGDFAGDAQHGAITAEDEKQIHRFGQGGGVRINRRLQAGQPGGGWIAENAPAGSGDEAGGFGDDAAGGSFFRVADEADALNAFEPVFSIRAKNSLFPAGPSNGDSVEPRQASLRLLRHKIFQLAQHPGMDGGVGDDAPAFVRLGFARLKLGFDQRHDSTRCAE